MKRALFAVLTVVIGVLVVGLTATVLSANAGEPAVIQAVPDGYADTPQGRLPKAKLEMSIYPQNSPGVPGPEGGVNAEFDNQQWPFYTPSTNLELPANSLVTIRITQFDSGGQIYNPYLADVVGTVDGTATYDGEKKTGIDPNNVGHTFTIHQYPEDTQPYLFVNIPVPANSANAPTDANGYPKDPHIIEFSFITGDAGEYIWNCEFPCGTGYVEFGGPMQQRGWMSGTVTVV